MQSELEDLWADVLSKIYRTANSKGILRRVKDRYTTFENVVEYGKYEPDVGKAVEVICNNLSICIPKDAGDSLCKLREVDKKAMRLLRRNPKLLALLAVRR